MHRSNTNQAPSYDSFPPRESVGELLGELASHSAALVRNEFELASTEIREKAGQYGVGAIVAVIGAIIALLGVIALCAAGVMALTPVVGLIAATLIVSGVLLLTGSIVLVVGIKKTQQIKPRLDQTLETLEENTRWAQSQLKS